MGGPWHKGARPPHCKFPVNMATTFWRDIIKIECAVLATWNCCAEPQSLSFVFNRGRFAPTASPSPPCSPYISSRTELVLGFRTTSTTCVLTGWNRSYCLISVKSFCRHNGFGSLPLAFKLGQSRIV
ncbi:hypothetical protein O181_055309 [Austropuccinia psidii MF-1]|uniref:Uncharacterized protein n=1 Tax=Austropuccinia psidii MF-1 TaxID=1389203 RepID=A0A9Q3E678_9BASI|nr:hypothetical protein [Austropuccinia psidii MF-1]